MGGCCDKSKQTESIAYNYDNEDKAGAKISEEPAVSLAVQKDRSTF